MAGTASKYNNKKTTIDGAGDECVMGKDAAVFDQAFREHFWARVDRSNPNGCWEWTAGRSKFGYGRLRHGGKDYVASRIAYELTKGQLLQGMCALHSCDNPSCCRPEHLFAGTTSDNNRDMINKGRQAKGAVIAKGGQKRFGDRNGTRLHPETRERGDHHWTHRMPERVAHVSGECHRAARLTWQKVNEIRTRYAAGGATLAQLSADYGVCFQHISDIVRNRKWVRHDG